MFSFCPLPALHLVHPTSVELALHLHLKGGAPQEEGHDPAHEPFCSHITHVQLSTMTTKMLGYREKVDERPTLHHDYKDVGLQGEGG